MAKSRPIIALLLTFGLLGVPSIAPAIGASNEAIWSQVNIPAGGEAGGWVLAEGSDVRHLALADDGTLYASVDGLGYTLYRSGDGGYSWSHCGGVTNAIVDIVVAADGIGTVYCATEGSIYRSTNAGDSYQTVASSPAPNGSSNIEITSIDVTHFEGDNIIVVGTWDADEKSQWSAISDRKYPFIQKPYTAEKLLLIVKETIVKSKRGWKGIQDWLTLSVPNVSARCFDI
jgi:hypothetical protein